MKKAVLVLRSSDGVDHVATVIISYDDDNDLYKKKAKVWETVAAVKAADPEEFDWEDMESALSAIDGVRVPDTLMVSDICLDAHI